MNITILTSEDDGTAGVPPLSTEGAAQPLTDHNPVPAALSPSPASGPDASVAQGTPTQSSLFGGLDDLTDEDLFGEQEEATPGTEYAAATAVKVAEGESRSLLLISCPLCAHGTHYTREEGLVGRQLCLGGPEKCPLCDGRLGKLEKTIIWPGFDITGGNRPIYFEVSAKAEWGKDEVLRAQANKMAKFAQTAAIMRSVSRGGTVAVEALREGEMRYVLTPRIVSSEFLPSAAQVDGFIAYLREHKQAALLQMLQVRTAAELRLIPVVKRALSLNGKA